jgi:hypothetical protein
VRADALIKYYLESRKGYGMGSGDDCQLPIAACRLPVADCRLLIVTIEIADCPLSGIHDTASPPDVRRWLRPAGPVAVILGLCPRCGLCPLLFSSCGCDCSLRTAVCKKTTRRHWQRYGFIKGKARTGGIAQVLTATGLAGQSHRLTSGGEAVP